MQISNLPDIRDFNGQWIRSYRVNGVQCVTRAGVLWANIVNRCGSNSHSKSFPSYSNCINGFTDFNSFAQWCQLQPGYIEKENNGRFWSIDKDILVPYNKTYSETTCCFVPNELNNILTYRKSGNLPLGVTLVRDSGKFRAKCSIGGIRQNLGTFDTKELAHRAWQEKKIEVIYKLISKHSNVRKDVLIALDKHAKMIENDISLNQESIR